MRGGGFSSPEDGLSLEPLCVIRELGLIAANLAQDLLFGILCDNIAPDVYPVCICGETQTKLSAQSRAPVPGSAHFWLRECCKRTRDGCAMDAALSSPECTLKIKTSFLFNFSRVNNSSSFINE